MAATTIGIIDGTGGDDVIIAAYTDADGENVADLYSVGPLIVEAGAGNDIVDLYLGGVETVNGENTVLHGGDGEDELSLSQGAAYGDDGDDYLSGYKFHTKLFGGAGNDFLRDESEVGGNLTEMTGGTGADTFDLYVKSINVADYGVNSAVVHDFEAGTDAVAIGGFPLDQADYLEGFAYISSWVGGEISIIQAGSDVKLVWYDYYYGDGSISGGAEMIIENTTIAGLLASGPIGGPVDGTSGDDLIDLGYVDAEGDTIYDSAVISDHVEAGDGDDVVILHRGDDVANGGAGDDLIRGQHGANVLHGNDGTDELHSGRDTSELFGDAGDDRLVAHVFKGGDHSLTGGADEDMFEMFRPADNRTADVVVNDFVVGEDILVISDLEGETPVIGSNLPEGITISEVDGNTVVHYGDDDTVTLIGVSNVAFTTDTGDGVVDGTDRAEMIDLGFVDADGESVTDDSAIVDMVIGAGGDDVIKVYAGDDTVMAGDGDDVIHGDKGANSLHGGAGNDLINSGRNTSELFGDDGDDTLNALLNKGADHTLTGGAGADAFNMLAASLTKMSNVEITDFTVGEDTLLIDGTLIDPFALPAGVTLDEDADGNSVLHFADDDTVTLTGVSNANLMGLEDPNGWVDGGKYDDVIDLDYVDESGEMVHDDASIVDEVHGKNGADVIKLYAGDDIAYAGAKDDVVYGMKGHNEIHGGTGDDYLHTGRNTSELFGDDGDDMLVAQLNKGADHMLEGGAGADWFEMSYASTTKTSDVQIADYEVGVDTLSIDGVVVTGGAVPADITVDANDAGDAVIHFLDDDTITLNGVTVEEFLGEEADPMEMMLPF